MPKLVLFGNSVNRLDGGPSWPGVLSELAAAAGLNPGLSFAGKPLPIVYEHIIHRANSDESAIKSRLASSMSALKPNWAHERALNLAAPHLLTTNYDYCFEQSAVGQQRVSGHLKSERTYSAFRRVQIGDRYVWHIHGELDAPRTILLGFHQYTGYIQKLRDYLTPRSSLSLSAGSPHFDQSGNPFSWADLFLRDDVHIAGLTMDYVELHLWWLIAYKLRLSKKGQHCGSTHFYTFAATDNGLDVETRLETLRDLDVQIHSIPVDKDWVSAHEEMFDRIETA